MNIRVRFHDITQGGGYSFFQPADFDQWTIVPRVGDYILDRNEFRYRVETVTWYDPGSARLEIKRER